MAFSAQQVNSIYDRTLGRCHICRKRLAFKNYGIVNARGAWEVEHSKPKSKGGTDHGNNLFAACISCNRGKNNGTSRSARARNGFKAAPYSQVKKLRNSSAGAGLFGSLGLLLAPPQIRIPVALFAAVVGGVIGYDEEPD